jgi:DNA processing protein
MEERYLWAALQKGLELGNRSLFHLYQHFPSATGVLRARADELSRVPRLSSQVINRILEQRAGIDPALMANQLEQQGIRAIMLGEEEYPSELAQIADPPVILYTIGSLPPQQLPLVAIVGVRQATIYGRGVARQLAGELARVKWGVVSGMARGIDTAAHQGSLAAGGYTMAVLGCGVDICYPRENAGLREEIISKGCVLSEYPPGTLPLSQNFPIRNRIISGCSLGTVVVEAGERSGALITADFAMEQGKEVFAVPGPITSPRSKGSNNLIKQGAKLVEDVTDVLSEFPYLVSVKQVKENRPKVTVANLTLDESLVLQQLSLDPLTVDQVAEATTLPVSVVGGLLTLLEFKGLVSSLPGQLYICADLSLLKR